MDNVLETTTSVAAGDAEALARLYEDRFDFVYETARRATHLDEATCLDMVQDVMMRVIRSLKPMPDTDSLNAWLVRVTRSVAYDHLRKERRRRRRELLSGAERQHEASRLSDDELTKRQAWLRDQLRGLDLASAELIEMRFRAGMTLERLGRRVGLQPGAVSGRISRVLGGIRRRAREITDD